MRTFVQAMVATLVVLCAAPSAAAAQDAAPRRPASSSAPAAAGLPKKPIPYAALRPKPRAPKPRPTPAPGARPAGRTTARTAAAPAAGSHVAGAIPQAAGVRSTAGAALAGSQPLPPLELERFIDGLVNEAMARDHVAGATVAVVQNGQLLLKKGYGFASLGARRPVDPDRTLFRLGSISKTFTWIGLMKEVEAGRIRLDQPINLYLPEKVQVRDQGYEQPVRVVNLLDHSAGFEDRTLGQLFERDFERVRPLTLYLRQERPRRVRPPGEVSSYSNYGAALAGEAVAWVGGRTFERLMEDEIFVPLGMRRTTFREPRPAKAGLPAPMPAELAGEVSAPFRWTPAGFRQRDFEYISQVAPAGSASSTAADMARYMLALLGGGQLDGVTIFGPRTAQAFRTPLRRTPPGINGWAHGFMIFDLPGGRRGYGHDGSTLSFMSNMVLVPDLNLGIFIATNTEGGGGLAARLPAALVGEFYAAPEPLPRPGSPALAQAAHAFAGDYLTNRRAYSGLEGFVDLFIGRMTVQVTSEGRLVTRDRQGAKVWVPEGALAQGRFVAMRGDERLAFDMADGRAQALRPADGAQLFERTSFARSPRVLLLLAGLTAAAATATLIGVPIRNRREFRENQTQSRASLVQNIQAFLWLAAMGLFGMWAAKTGDAAQVVYTWPGALLITASACALVAAVLTVTTLVALPAVWRGGRRVDSWRPARKLSFSITLLIYAAFSLLLANWGALAPWSS